MLSHGNFGFILASWGINPSIYMNGLIENRNMVIQITKIFFKSIGNASSPSPSLIHGKGITCSNCRYIFSTEGHLLPATPQISLVREHCSYLGAYCNDSNSRVQTRFSDFANDLGETNGSYTIPAASVSRASSNFHASTVSGLIKVLSWSPCSAFL